MCYANEVRWGMKTYNKDSFSTIDLLIFSRFLLHSRCITESQATGAIVRVKHKNGSTSKEFHSKNMEIYIDNGSCSIIANLYKTSLFGRKQVGQFVLTEHENRNFKLVNGFTGSERISEYYPHYRREWKEAHPDKVEAIERAERAEAASQEKGK